MFLRIMSLFAALLLSGAAYSDQTLLPRAAQTDPSLTLGAGATTVVALPAGSFPFKTQESFGMLNVAASNESAVEHFDPVTYALLGKTLIGAPPANNVSSLDSTATELVLGDYGTAKGVWWTNPITMTVNAFTATGVPIRDVVTCIGNVYATSDTGNVLLRLDPSTHAITGTLSVPNAYRTGCDGVRYLWVTTCANDQVAKIDLTTFTWVATYSVPVCPWSVEVDGDRIWIGTNGGGAPIVWGAINYIDVNTNAVSTYNMGTGNALHSIRRGPGNRLYGADANGNGIIVFDTEAMKVIRFWNTGPNTIGMDLNKKGDRLITTIGNNSTLEIRNLERAW